MGDLGVSKLVDDLGGGEGQAHTRVGTPLYLAPEQVKHQSYSYKVDLWALGCLLYLLTALEPPFHGHNLIQLGHDIVRRTPKPLSDKYSQEWRSLVSNLLTKRPQERPDIFNIQANFQQSIPRRIRQSLAVQRGEHYIPVQRDVYVQNPPSMSTNPLLPQQQPPGSHLQGGQVLMNLPGQGNFPNGVNVQQGNMQYNPQSQSQQLSGPPQKPPQNMRPMSAKPASSNFQGQLSAGTNEFNGGIVARPVSAPRMRGAKDENSNSMGILQQYKIISNVQANHPQQGLSNSQSIGVLSSARGGASQSRDVFSGVNISRPNTPGRERSNSGPSVADLERRGSSGAISARGPGAFENNPGRDGCEVHPWEYAQEIPEEFAEIRSRDPTPNPTTNRPRSKSADGRGGRQSDLESRLREQAEIQRLQAAQALSNHTDPSPNVVRGTRSRSRERLNSNLSDEGGGVSNAREKNQEQLSQLRALEQQRREKESQDQNSQSQSQLQPPQPNPPIPPPQQQQQSQSNIHGLNQKSQNVLDSLNMLNRPAPRPQGIIQGPGSRGSRGMFSRMPMSGHQSLSGSMSSSSTGNIHQMPPERAREMQDLIRQQQYAQQIVNQPQQQNFMQGGSSSSTAQQPPPPLPTRSRSQSREPQQQRASSAGRERIHSAGRSRDNRYQGKVDISPDCDEDEHDQYLDVGTIEYGQATTPRTLSPLKQPPKKIPRVPSYPEEPEEEDYGATLESSFDETADNIPPQPVRSPPKGFNRPKVNASGVVSDLGGTENLSIAASLNGSARQLDLGQVQAAEIRQQNFQDQLRAGFAQQPHRQQPPPPPVQQQQPLSASTSNLSDGLRTGGKPKSKPVRMGEALIPGMIRSSGGGSSQIQVKQFNSNSQSSGSSSSSFIGYTAPQQQQYGGSSSSSAFPQQYQGPQHQPPPMNNAWKQMYSRPNSSHGTNSQQPQHQPAGGINQQPQVMQIHQSPERIRNKSPSSQVVGPGYGTSVRPASASMNFLKERQRQSLAALECQSQNLNQQNLHQKPRVTIQQRPQTASGYANRGRGGSFAGGDAKVPFTTLMRNGNDDDFLSAGNPFGRSSPIKPRSTRPGTGQPQQQQLAHLSGSQSGVVQISRPQSAHHFSQSSSRGLNKIVGSYVAPVSRPMSASTNGGGRKPTVNDL